MRQLILQCRCAILEASKGPQTIRFCDVHHKYWFADRELLSVSKLIHAVYPRKTFDGVDPAIVENARERGVLVDQYLSQYLKTGDVSIEPGEREDVLDYLHRAIRWVDRNLPNDEIRVQEVVYNVDHGIAATIDIHWGESVLDFKCVSELQPSYQIQLGCHAEYTHAEQVGILHVTKSKCEYVGFDVTHCRRMFAGARQWHSLIQQMENI